MNQTQLAAIFEKHQELVQTEVAEAADISQSYLSLLISGQRVPSLPVARRLVVVLRQVTGEELTIESLFASPNLPTAANE